MKDDQIKISSLKKDISQLLNYQCNPDSTELLYTVGPAGSF